MRYNDRTLNSELNEVELIPNLEDIDKQTKTKENAHAVRRNIEDYLAQKALERSLQDVFEDDYLLD